jgi:AraC-like DNA-binding protein
MAEAASRNEPLHRFPVFSTADPETLRAVALSAYGATRVELSRFDGVPSRGNLVALSDIALGYSVCGEATVHFPEADFARQQFALNGSCSIRTGRLTSQVTAQQSCVSSPGEAATLRYGREFAQLYIRVSRGALERKLAALLGAPARGRLRFDLAAPMASPRVQGLWQLTNFLAQQLNADPAPLSPVVRGELEQALMLAFLYANPHTFSALLERDAEDTAPRQVILAEEFIRTHSDQVITIEQLAAVSGVSARTLFKAFRRHRGFSPHQLAKRVRLERARGMLAAPDTRTSVTGVAFTCGFANLGHFARDYRTAFGELPSAALARSSSRRGIDRLAAPGQTRQA